MIITSLPNTHSLQSTRTAVLPSKTIEVKPSKSLRLIATPSTSREPSSTRSSPEKSSSSPLKKPATLPAPKPTSHNLRQQYPSPPQLKRSVQSKKKKLITDIRSTLDKTDTTRHAAPSNDSNGKELAAASDKTQERDYANTLEAKLEAVTFELQRERERVQSMELEMQQLKDEIIRLRHDGDVIDTLRMTDCYTCPSLKEENKQLKTTVQQTESECLRMMDELLAIEKADEDKKMCRGEEIEQLYIDLKQEKEKYRELEESHQEKLNTLHRDIFTLECLVESKVFQETDLEAAIEIEREKVKALEMKLKEEQEKNLTISSQRVSPSKQNNNVGRLENAVYCEICEEYGHDVITCTALQIGTETCYCINCEVFDLHSSEECPNQDETF